MNHKIYITITENQKSQIMRAANSRNISTQDLVRRALIEKGVMTTTDIERPKSTSKKGKYVYYRIQPKVFDITRIIAAEFEVNIRDVHSDKRHREIVTARHCFRYILKNKIKISLSEVGKLSNYADHSSIIHSIETFQNILDTEPMIREKYERVKRLTDKIKL